MSVPSPSATAQSGRTWPQRLAIASLLVVSVLSFGAAAALITGQWIVSSRNLVVLESQDAPSDTGSTRVSIITPGQTGTDTAADSGEDSGEDTDDDAPPVTFPPAEPGAKNFLITGADNNACIDADSRFAPAFGDRESFGERSDTIMVWRVNPVTRQVAILSFPRDLYVDIADGGRARINTAYRRDDPERLRATILQNFGIPIDHFIQVDFCAFKRMVDAVGGVEVPFEYPARDPRSGLFVPEVGCFNFEGDHALAYVRSRYYEYEDPAGSGNWKRDGTSDLGRISRQQDFLRRTVASVLSRGAYTPSVVSGLIETNSRYLTVDSELTLSRMLEFAGVLQSLDPGAIASYQIESTPQTISGNAVLVPRLGGDNMQAILSVFRGEATLADAPEQEFDSTASSVPRPGQQTGSGDDDAPQPGTGRDEVGTGSGSDTVPGTTIPEVVADENTLGISPPRHISC